MKIIYVTVALASTAAAQTPTGVVVSSGTDQPVPYSTIMVSDGGMLQGRFTDAAGRFVVSPGSHRVRASNIGFYPLDTTVAVSGPASPVVLRLHPLAVDANAVSPSPKRCTATGLGDATSQPVLALLRENADRYNILRDAYPFSYRFEERRYVHLSASAREGANSFTGYTPGSDSTIAFDTASYDSRDRRPYAAGHVVYRQGGSSVMALPTLSDLADSSFQATHCFAFAGSPNGELRIDFRPADAIHTPDVAGSVYLDASRYVVRRAVFQLTHPEALNESLSEFTVTSTFQEVAPFVPMLATARTEQHIRPHREDAVTNGTGYGMQTSMVHYTVDQDHHSVDEDRMLSHTFLGDTIGSLAFGAPRAPADTRVSVAIECRMPPSFETADVTVYATLAGPGATNASASAVLAALRPLFHLPNDPGLSVYSSAIGSKVAQALDGQVAFTIDASGDITKLATTATSLSPGVDAALIAAVQQADASRVFARLRAAGRYTLSLSSASPPAGAHALPFARVAADVLPLARAAALDPDSAQPHLPVGGAFQFVVDESGRAMPGTLLALTPAPDAATAAATQALPDLRFRPALVGQCPIKQEITLTGR